MKVSQHWGKEKYGLKVKRMISFSRPTLLPTGIKG